MATVTLELDDALLGAAAHALGTRSAADTVRAALEAATRSGGTPARIPGSHPSPGPDRLPLGDSRLGQPDVPGRTDFPRPPEIH